MTKWTKVVLITVLGLALAGGAAAVYAQQGTPKEQPQVAIEPPTIDPPPLDEPPLDLGEQLAAQGELSRDRRPLPGLRGVVTAVHDSGLTMLVRGEKSVEVNVHSGTKIWLVETQSQGSLVDIEVGDHLLVQGCRCGDASIGAQRIIVGPDGDEVRGKVTGIEGTTIQLETRDGQVTVRTDANTVFRVGREEGSLENVTVGVGLVAFGQMQADGSLDADLVLIQARAPRPRARNVRGEVTAVSSTGLTLRVQRKGPDAPADPLSLEVQVTENTKVWLVETQSQGSLADVEVGDKVAARGLRAETSTPEAPVMVAAAIAVGPDGDEVHGRVVAVEGAQITIENREGQVTLRTDEGTQFRRGRQEGSLEDVTEGRFLVAFGEDQGEGRFSAALVYIRRGPPRERGPTRGMNGLGA
jgi:hypothetical protein